MVRNILACEPDLLRNLCEAFLMLGSVLPGFLRVQTVFELEDKLTILESDYFSRVE